ncbi:MAG TPA: winged helix-turn-helix domain-containing protein, partial [Alphaproteobacteria bacterium]|nr:winged helix-turn-helix domain-containing protein [Alphaproteobacteria bacterium]
MAVLVTRRRLFEPAWDGRWMKADLFLIFVILRHWGPCMDRPAAWRAIAVDLDSERPFRVGGATVDPVSREATYAAGRERLQPQTLKVLIALVRRNGEVVTRSELIDSCWGGRIVGEDVINRSISILRDFAERSGGFTIETIPKSGYRLMRNDRRSPYPTRALLPAFAVLLVAAILAGLWAMASPQESKVQPPVVALRPLTSSGDAASRDLAAATGDALAHMMVAGSFHGKLEWPATPRDEAEADLILSGDVRRTGDTYAAMVKLNDRRSGTLLFSERFDAPIADPSLLPEQVGAQISSNLTGALALMILDRRQSGSPELTAEKLKTIAVTVSEADPLVSYEISRRMIETQPNSVLAQIGLAYDTAFALSSLPRQDRRDAVIRARIAADRLQMAPDFGDTYAPWCLLHPPSEARECEDRLRAGMKA